MAGRRMRWALIASLAVNLLVVAAVAGALLTRFDGPRSRDRAIGGPPDIRALARGLDQDSRQALIRGLRSDPDLRGGRGRLREARAGIAAALRAKPFDRAAFEAALADRRDVQAALAARGASALADVIADLSPETRAELADRLTSRR